MYPHDLHVLNLRLSIWNAALLAGVLLGYIVLRSTLLASSPTGLPRRLFIRWMVTVYVSAIGAQLFSYAFDRGTGILPPPAMSAVRFYLDPLVGTKTLYGAILALPLAVAAVTRPWRDLAYARALDAWTAPLCTVLAVTRLGCFLNGCCYGVESRWLGARFAPGSLLYWEQVQAGLITPGSWTRPVLPVQLIEASVLLVLARWTFELVRRGERSVFVAAVVGYSIARFGLEAVRADPARNAFGPLSTSQWVALLVLVVGFLTRRRRACGEPA